MIIENVLSLFDGISCGQQALEKAGFIVGNYYASEINKQAIKVTQKNYSNTIQLGDVLGVRGGGLPKIDLLLGGSPCQGFSTSGKGLNFEDPRSKLFFEFVRIKEETKPKYFLLENVVMKEEYRRIISDHLGVEPILINSSLVSAQVRKRYYWTNIPGVIQPKDKGIDLESILESREFLNKGYIVGRRLDERGVRADYNINIKRCQYLEVNLLIKNKCNCLTTVAKDNVLTNLPIGRHKDPFKNKLPFRYYTSKEYCRLQTINENYFNGVATDSQIREMIGNSWNVDTIVHILNYMK